MDDACWVGLTAINMSQSALQLERVQRLIRALSETSKQRLAIQRLAIQHTVGLEAAKTYLDSPATSAPVNVTDVHNFVQNLDCGIVLMDIGYNPTPVSDVNATIRLSQYSRSVAYWALHPDGPCGSLILIARDGTAVLHSDWSGFKSSLKDDEALALDRWAARQ